MPGTRATPEDLLVHAGWLRRLALRLVRDGDVADDLLQETWITAIRRPPSRREDGDGERPWLAKVLRDAFRMRRRGDARRAAREDLAAVAAGEVATPERLVERAQTQRLLVDLVLRLDEPYRTTVLLHFYEGVSAADIARAQSIPAGTVRWRLHEAIERIRVWLDAETGARRRWAVALMALPKGMLVMHKTWKLAIVFLLLLLLGGGAILWKRRAGAPAGDEAAGARAGRPGGASKEWRDGGAGEDEGAGRLVEPVWAAQAGATPRPIAGVVVYQGEPVAGAEVLLQGWAAAALDGSEARAVTGADGRFAFAPRRAWSYVVTAAAPGRTAAFVRVDPRDPAARPPTDELVLELGPCDAAVYGVITDARGTPIPGARVRHLATARLNQNGPFGPVVEAGADGAYEVCVPRGTTYLSFRAEGYGALHGVVDCHARHRLDAILTPEGVVVGTTVDADTGEPVPHTQVNLWPPARGPMSPDVMTGVSDASGRFQIDGVAGGRYRLGAWPPADHVFLEAQEVVVESGQTTGPLRIALHRGAVVSGLVVEGGQPVAGAALRMVTTQLGVTSGTGIESRSYDAVTQADGSFSVHGLPADSVSSVEVTAYEVLSPKSVTVAGAKLERLVVEVASLGAVRGRVVLDAAGAHGSASGEGVAAAGARVVAWPRGAPPREGARQRLATTGADGTFELRGLAAGRYQLRAESVELAAMTLSPVDVDVRDRETVDGVVLRLDAAASIAGVVVDAGGAPVEGAQVHFARAAGDDAGSAVTAVDGSFAIGGLAGGGEYRASVKPFRLAPAELAPTGGAHPTVRLDGKSSRATGVRLVVERAERAIAGRVLDAAGAPVADALVRVSPMAGAGAPDFAVWVPWPSTRTDPAGAFTLRVWDEGRYALQAQLGNEAPSVMADVRGGASDVIIRLVRGGAIAGTLIDLAASSVHARREGGGSYTTSTYMAHVTGSTFRIEHMTPGTYLVTAASSDGRGGATRVDVSAGQTATVRLASRGRARVRGTVLSFPDGAPVADVRCYAAPTAGDALPANLYWNYPLSTAVSDEQGRFTIDPAPAGEGVVFCTGDRARVSDGLTRVTPAAGGEATVQVLTVQRRAGGRLGTTGMRLNPMSLSPSILEVQTGGSADLAGFRAGDRIVAVDGRAVDGLGSDAVTVLIADRPPGSRVAVTATRGGETVTGDLDVGPP